MELSEKAKSAVASYLAKFGIDLPAKKVETPAGSAGVKLEDVKLIDGTMLSVDKMEVGASATFTDADGVAIPAEGEFELEDGTKVICAAGVISEIMPKAEETAAPVEEDMKAILSKLSDRLDAIEKSNAVKTNLETELAETKKGLGVALSAINELNNSAVALSLESQKEVKKVVKSYDQMSNHEKMLFNRGKL